MSLARKMKKQNLAKLKDAVDKETKDTIRKDARGLSIALRMQTAIEDMCWATITPLFLWVLHQDFGFGAERLFRMSEEYNRHIMLVNDTHRADKLRSEGKTLPEVGGPFPHHYIDMDEMLEGLKTEAGYEYIFTPVRKKIPAEATQQQFTDWHATKLADMRRDSLRLIWLYTMWSVFGFGKSRLAKLNTALVEQIENLTPEVLSSYMEELERLDKKGGRISFVRTREILKDVLTKMKAA